RCPNRDQDCSLLTQQGNYLLDHGFDYRPAVEIEIPEFARRYGVECALGCEQMDGVLLPCAWRSADVCAKLRHEIELAPALLAIETPHAGISKYKFQEGGPQPS